MPRLATYLIPDPETRLYQIGSAILGYDVFPTRTAAARAVAAICGPGS
jgi:hypothetical protein